MAGCVVSDARTIAVEVAVRRREWATQAGDDHFEGLPAHDRRWLDELDDAVTVLCEAACGANEVDPKKAVLDVLAIGTAWLEQMG